MDPRINFKCPYCGEENIKGLVSLQRHVRRKHDVEPERLYQDVYLVGARPTCACGCGRPTRFTGMKTGFSTFAPGHQARVSNNWGHNKKALAKSQDVRREQIAAGEWNPWNKGETKDTDPRIASYGETQSKNFTKDRRRARSERMKSSWTSGTLAPLTGSAHSQWKGGTSALQPYVRAHLYRAWSYPIMERDGFACQCCGRQSELCVHHSDVRFIEVLRVVMEEMQVTDGTQLDFQQKEKVAAGVIEYHRDHDVVGITLCDDCHRKVHT